MSKKNKSSHQKHVSNLSRASDKKKKPSSTKTYPFYYNMILLIIPIMLIIAIEVTLRVADYGKNLDQWIKATDTEYLLNPDVGFRYFYNTETVPYSARDLFDIEKKSNSYRVFILGGSSAAGYPYTPAASFSKYIRKRLQLLYPENKIEVVNLAFAAINTYTILDLLPGVLEQKPDLILIYAGHNEFYGALGAGSMESLGNSPTVVNFMLGLNKFKTTQFIRNTIKSIYSLIGDGEKPRGTLMARMAKEQTIELDSDIYTYGMDQFKENFEEIIYKIKETGIKVIASDLVSNLKDQKPFISIENGTKPSADSIYGIALSQYAAGNLDISIELFKEAKDLDGLRFRASSELNEIIIKVCSQNNVPVVNSENEFNSLSKSKIADNELMTDHLHPTVTGYHIIGKLFFNAMIKHNYLPTDKAVDLSIEAQDEFVKRNFNFTKLDSTIARYRIIALKADWPYVEKSLSVERTLKIMQVKNYLDSLALKVLDDKITWEKAHRSLALRYIRERKIDLFKDELAALTDLYPYIDEYYSLASKELLAIKEFDEAYNYLIEYDENRDDQFTSKWIGIISLSRNDFTSAIKHLEKSLRMNPNDAQALYNLSGAYSQQKKYKEALDMISRCLQVNPNYKGAKEFQAQLLAAVK
ncbi:MAG: tetratricopeptide repeat protein [Bacteroidetes bacterium]|nr:tetratricopeptide repeat protein [Bacteroidota bacterium]